MVADKMLELEVRGLKETQDAARAVVQALQPDGAAGAAIQFSVLGLHRYMTTIVHVDTGRLKNSLFPQVDGLTGMVITNVNYAPYEEARDGSGENATPPGPHNFMGRTEKEQGKQIADQALKEFNVKITQGWEQTA